MRYFSKKKESFMDSQAKFNQPRQKPNKSITYFINEFNIASAEYLNASSHMVDEGTKNVSDLIK